MDWRRGPDGRTAAGAGPRCHQQLLGYSPAGRTSSARHSEPPRAGSRSKSRPATRVELRHVRSPGDYNEVLTTGSVNHARPSGTLTGFSSRGPRPGPTRRTTFPTSWPRREHSLERAGGATRVGGAAPRCPVHTPRPDRLMWSACPTFAGRSDTSTSSGTPRSLDGGAGSNCGGDYTTGRTTTGLWHD